MGASKWNNNGLKFFELSNHLGNVMAVINDNRNLAGGTYEPVVINASDYYAFGSQMIGRTFTETNALAYRYGFNGKENDNEVKGEGNQQDYGMRIYDPRIGRFLSVDPITAKYPELTPYQFASNRPIDGVDLDGKEYLKAEEFTVEFKAGKLKIKVANLSSTSRASYNLAVLDHNLWTPGHVGVDLTIGVFTLNNPTNIPGLGDIPGDDLPKSVAGEVSNSVPYDRYGRRTYSSTNTSAVGGGKLTKGMAILDAIKFGFEKYAEYNFNSDNEKIRRHTGVAQLVVENMDRALKIFNLVPEKYRNEASIAAIMNVILQGKTNSNDPEIYKLGMKIFHMFAPKADKHRQTIVPSGLDNNGTKKYASPTGGSVKPSSYEDKP